jgi:hypothetical protein
VVLSTQEEDDDDDDDDDDAMMIRLKLDKERCSEHAPTVIGKSHGS